MYSVFNVLPARAFKSVSLPQISKSHSSGSIVKDEYEARISGAETLSPLR